MNMKVKDISTKIATVVLAGILATGLIACNKREDQNVSPDPVVSPDTPAETSTVSDDLAGTELSSDSYGMDFTYSDRDQDPSYEESTSTKITLSDAGSSAAGEGVDIGGSMITITQAGAYIVNGELSNGSLVVAVADDEKVQIVLDGATIHCETGAAVVVESADKVFVTLASGSENALSDGSTHEISHDDNDHDGVIFSHSDLAFNGGGLLTVIASYANGIVSKDDLVITSGAYVIDAVNDGLQGKDNVKILDGDVSITAGQDGIKSNNAEDSTRGFVSIDGGSFEIISGNDGIQAETVLRIAGGTFDIESGEGATGDIVSSSMGGGMPGGGGMGPGSEMAMPDDNYDSSSTVETESTKGLKAGQLVEIQVAEFTISSLDDAIHSNGSISILGGNLILTSDDDGVHAENTLLITDGNIEVINSYEGLEAAKIQIKNGDIHITAVDDGMNAASDSAGEYELLIEGGNVYVLAGGDGLDSNSALTVTGGTTVVYSTSSGDNSALDADGAMTISGGTVVAGGPSQMAETFSGSSTQSTIMYTANGSLSEGSVLGLADSSGNIVLAMEIQQSCQNIVFSTSDLIIGETYSLFEDVNLGSDVVYGVSKGGSTQDAQLLVQFTLSDTSIVVSTDGQVSAATEGTGGMGPGGGVGGGTPPGGNDMGERRTPPAVPNEEGGDVV